MHVDDVGLRIEVVVPDMLQQHRARHDLPGVASSGTQETGGMRRGWSTISWPERDDSDGTGGRVQGRRAR